jgi:hypothetical protein
MHANLVPGLPCVPQPTTEAGQEENPAGVTSGVKEGFLG